jgi:hypothetical protein
MNSLTIAPDTPFSLQAAGSSGFGPHTGRPEPDDADVEAQVRRILSLDQPQQRRVTCTSVNPGPC